MDIHNNKKKLEVGLKRLDSEKNISNKNKKDIKEFVQYCLSQDLSYARTSRYLIELIVIARSVNITLSKATRRDIENILVKIREGDLIRKTDRKKIKLSKWTQVDYKKAIKKFYTWLNKPELCKDIATDLSRKEKQQILPKLEDLPNSEDVEKMLQKCLNKRDKALISFLFDSGARIGEALAIKLKDIQFKEQYCVVRVSGKTGERYIPIRYCYPYLKEWYEDHPYKEDVNNYFFINLRNGSKNYVCYRYVNKMLKKVAKLAKVKKSVNPHAFRHASASIKCHYLSYADMNAYFGWIQGSDMPATYLHMSPKGIENSMKRIWGINEKEDNDEKAMKGVICPSCGYINKPTNDFCDKCRYVLNEKLALELERRRKEREAFLDKMINNPKLMELMQD